MLGRVIREQGGKTLLRDVERLRRLVIAARGSARHERMAERLVASWTLDRAEQVARAFATYFHLVNLAEEHHRARVLRDRGRGTAPAPESLAATIPDLRRRLGRRRLERALSELEVHPVFTSHPTEARRRAVMTAIGRVGEQLERLNDVAASSGERASAERRMLEEVDILWRTSQLRASSPEPLDEVRSLTAVFDETLFRLVPEVYRALDDALEPGTSGSRPPLAPSFLRFGSWVGGDRDGNPFVTAATTRDAMLVQAEHAGQALFNAALRIGRSLTADAATTPASAALHRRLEAMRRSDPERMAQHVKRSPGEPHRQFLLFLADRIAAGEAPELVSDLRVLQASLAAAGATRIAYGEVQHLLWQAETFGTHFAELEIRQHSRVLERAIFEAGAGERVPGGKLSEETEELLETFRAMAAIQRRFGVEACRRFVVSFTRGARDVANVYALARLAAPSASPVIDAVPLFETGEDLRRAVSVLDEIITSPLLRRRLAETDRRLEVMLGYSDSAKESGPVAASLALYEAQAALARWARRRAVRLTIFHGRGGALGRGGGPANRAVRAQAPGSVAGRFKVTEQGEVIFARYGNPAIARRHLEQVTSAVLEASTRPVQQRAERAARRFRKVALEVGDAARASYRRLIETPGFEEWFARVTPIAELSRMRVGSRPAHRGGRRTFEELRAIPWVFAWSQTRLNLPGWYGLGSGLSAAEPGILAEAYRTWPLFNVLVDNAEMSLAKTDRLIAARYLALGGRSDLTELVLAEYDLSLAQVLAVTGHRRLLEDRRVLSWAIELRNPYVDALSHLQLRGLRAVRARRGGKSADRLLMLSINGVAAGLQNTG